jgi:hypothetical protein
MSDSNSNDISVPILLSATNTTARIHLEETAIGKYQNVTLSILLIKPDLT